MTTYPRICHEVGLDCETCTEDTARNLAKICAGLKGKLIGQMFVQIYTDPACARMHGHFAAAYLSAAGMLERKGPQFELFGARPGAIAAVA